MKTRPIHENLDTSFVNLSALLRYLQRRQFVGRIRVELSGYEADIILLAGNKMQVREHDLLAGRIADGEEALQRLLIRAHEPGGKINVYQTLSEPLKNPPPVEKPKPVAAAGTKPIPEALPKPAISGNVGANGNGGNGKAHQAPKPVVTKTAEMPVTVPPKPVAPLPNFPFDLTNEVEAKARQTQQISPHEWQTLLQLIGELLGAIDKTLAEARLNFSGAFTKVRAEIAADYPFLNPADGAFEYADGKVSMRERPSARLFVAGINESLRRILEKLGASQKFAPLYRAVAQKIVILIEQRRPLYEKFSITPQLERFLRA